MKIVSRKRDEIHHSKHQLQLDIWCLVEDVEDDYPIRFNEIFFFERFKLNAFRIRIKNAIPNSEDEEAEDLL